MALESIDFTKSGNDEEDLSSYFLQPSSSPYNIAEKVQQANFDLFNSNVEWTRKAKVKFKDELVSFEPDLTDDDVNSIESDHVLEDTSNPDSNFIDTANLEAHVQTTTDEKRTIPQFANEKAISDISEAADCSVDILEEIEEIQEEFEESCDYQTTLREEFIHIWESENSCKFEEDQLQFEEDLTEYRKNDSESTSTGDSKNIKTSKIESPPDKTEQKVTHRINTAENSHKKSKKGVRKDLRASEIRCKDHCIEKIDHSLSMSIKKLEIHEKSSINLPPLQLHQRNCCDNLKYSNTSRNLPKYNGYRSEYGLTIRQLKKRDRYMEIIKQKEVTRQKLMEEYRRLKIQQNEEVFCQWLKEITTRRRQQQFNKDSRSTSSSSGAVKSLTSPKIMNLPSDNKNISKADKNKQYSRPKTAGYNEFVPKTNAKRRRRPHTTNSCVYIEVPREILHKGIQIDKPKPTMSDRRKELELKKQKLQALREEKERRRKEKEQKDVEEATHRAILGGGGDRKELDSMLSEVGIAPLSEVYSSISSVNSNLTPEANRNHTPDASLQLHSLPNNLSAVKKKTPQLTIVPVQTTSIPPKDIVVYTKQTQTTASGHEMRDAHATDYYDEYNLNPGLEWEDEFTVLTYDEGEEDESSLPHLGGYGSKLPPGILPHGLPSVKEVQPAVTTVQKEAKKEEEEKKIRELSEEEKQMIILSEDFQQFIGRAGRVVERALCESVDIYTDYSGIGEEALDEKCHQRISFNRTFYDERWSKNRTITSLDWSPQFPELLLASYNSNEESPNDPDGVVLVWNTKFKKTTPEYIFHCQSAVLSTTFARFHPNLILGGTYSGQIVLWDNRVQKRTPIQRTPLSASAHTHPVYCMSVVGTQNAHNLISISTDGRMCSWSLDMLGQPQEILDLHRMQGMQGKPVAITCLDFPSSDVNNFVVGSEEGAAYSACRHGTKAGIIECYDGHQGPITGISVNAVQGGIDFSHMFLTSSFDWTIKLWSLKDQKPIYSFDDNGDYVLDVQWSPVHPALFASVDCSGRLDLWNLNQDTEVPAASITNETSAAFNKVSWTPSGLHVTVGDNTGRIHVYDVAENFAHPRHDEWNKFLYTTEELRNSQVDEELERLNYSVSSVNSTF